MNKKNAGVVFILLLTGVFAGQVLAQGSGIKFNSNADDIAKIGILLEEFRQDIIHKDGYALTKLMLYPSVLFHSIDNQEAVDNARKLNAQFRWDWSERTRWICNIARYVKGQTRRDVSQHRDSPGRRPWISDI